MQPCLLLPASWLTLLPPLLALPCLFCWDCSLNMMAVPPPHSLNTLLGEVAVWGHGVSAVGAGLVLWIAVFQCLTAAAASAVAAVSVVSASAAPAVSARSHAVVWVTSNGPYRPPTFSHVTHVIPCTWLLCWPEILSLLYLMLLQTASPSGGPTYQALLALLAVQLSAFCRWCTCHPH